MKETRDACCTITVRSRLGDYPALIYESPAFWEELAAIPNGALVVDRRVYELYRGMWIDAFGDRPVFLFDAEETGKTLEGASKLYEWLTGNFAAKRNLNLISFGVPASPLVKAGLTTGSASSQIPPTGSLKAPSP